MELIRLLCEFCVVVVTNLCSFVTKFVFCCCALLYVAVMQCSHVFAVSTFNILMYENRFKTYNP